MRWISNIAEGPVSTPNLKRWKVSMEITPNSENNPTDNRLYMGRWEIRDTSGSWNEGRTFGDGVTFRASRAAIERNVTALATAEIKDIERREQEKTFKVLWF